jgi:hypothetical protein
MAKEDVVEDLPAQIPKKRKQIQELLSIHIAMWLDSDIPTPSERRKLEEEKRRRKNKAPDKVVGLLVGDYGMTPLQLETLKQLLAESGATEIRHSGVSSRIHTACKEIAPVVYHDQTKELDPYEVIKTSDMIIATPKEPRAQPYSTPGMWSHIGYAKNRSLPVRIIYPDGEV